MPKQLSLRFALLVLSYSVATLLFGRTREMDISACNVVYIGSI